MREQTSEAPLRIKTNSEHRQPAGPRHTTLDENFQRFSFDSLSKCRGERRTNPCAKTYQRAQRRSPDDAVHARAQTGGQTGGGAFSAELLSSCFVLRELTDRGLCCLLLNHRSRVYLSVVLAHVCTTVCTTVCTINHQSTPIQSKPARPPARPPASAARADRANRTKEERSPRFCSGVFSASHVHSAQNVQCIIVIPHPQRAQCKGRQGGRHGGRERTSRHGTQESAPRKFWSIQSSCRPPQMRELIERESSRAKSSQKATTATTCVRAAHFLQQLLGVSISEVLRFGTAL